MPETLSISLDLPKDLVNRIKGAKPPWLTDLTDEQFVGHVIARGNFDDYLGQIHKANQQVQTLTAELHLKKGGDPPLKGKKGGRRAEIRTTSALPAAVAPSPAPAA